MAITFNDKMNPKARVSLFKIYADVDTTGMSPDYELQGRGITTWTVENNQDLNVNSDVLDFNDFERGTAKPQQSVEMSLRKDSKLGALLFDCWFKGDFTPLDNVSILQKFEFVDAPEKPGSCLARLQKECAINITSFMGEAENYLKFAVDIYYSNKIETGSMTVEDAEKVVFTPDGAEA